MFKNVIKKIGLTLVICIMFLMMSVNVSAMTPSYTADHSPDMPVAGSEITFSVNFTNDSNINDVYIKYKECNSQICFETYNVSMSSLGSGLYDKELSLEETGATYVEYQLVYNYNGSWISSNWTKVDLEAYSGNNNGGNGEDDGDDSNGIPGFEILFVLVALAIFIVYIRRVRKK